MNSLTIDPQDDVSAIIAMFRAQLKDPTRPFTLLVRFQTADSHWTNAESAFAVARKSTLKEKGVVAFELNRDASNPSRFVVYERWRSLADLEEHLRTPYITKLRDEFNQIIVGAPEFIVLTPAAE